MGWSVLIHASSLASSWGVVYVSHTTPAKKTTTTALMVACSIRLCAFLNNQFEDFYPSKQIVAMDMIWLSRRVAFGAIHFGEQRQCYYDLIL